MSANRMTEPPRESRLPSFFRRAATAALLAAALAPAALAAPRAGSDTAARSGSAPAAEQAVGRGADPVSLEDLTALVREGVGPSIVIRQIRRSGVDFDPTVQALLVLRRAGATDEVLDAVLDAYDRAGRSQARSDGGPSRPAHAGRGTDRAVASPSEETTTLRIYRATDSRGREALVLTNLDDAGNRLGGEIRSHQEPNIVASPDPPARREQPRHPAVHRVTVGEPGSEGDGGVAVSDEDGGAVSPVTVIIQNGTAAPAQPAPQPVAGPYYPGGCGPWGCGSWIGGGIVGGFKYPDHWFFLGYDPRNSINVANPPAPGDIHPFQPPPQPAPKGR